MSKLNRTVKYILCTAATAILTVAIVFMPYLYYYAKDSGNGDTYDVESFSFDNLKTSVSYNELMTLLKLENSIWVDEKEQISENDINAVIDAVKIFKEVFPKNDYVDKVFDTFLNDPGLKIDCYQASILSGVGDDIPMSVSFLYVEYSGENFEYASILLDRHTNMIYQFSIYALEDNPFYGEELPDNEEFYYDSPGEAEVYNEIYDAVSYGAYKYWRGSPQINIYRYSFELYLFGMDYNTIRYDDLDWISEYNEN